MKKTLLIVTLVVSALAILGVGLVYAQEATPPYTGHGPMRNGEGPLHTFMVIEFAKKLDLNVNDVNKRIASGETMYDIAISSGVAVEDFPAIMTEIRSNALAEAVKANVISQEQADWMNSHGFGRGGMMGNGAGNCDGTGSQNGQYGRGRGMMGQGYGMQYQQTNP